MITGETRGRVKSRNMYRELMDKDHGVESEFNVGGGGWAGQGRVMGGKWGQL